MTQISALILVGFILGLSACKTNPNKARVLETEIETSSAVSKDERVGVDADKDMVYQKQLSLTEEIRRLQNSVVDSEDRVYGTRAYNTTGLLGEYRKCHNKLSDSQKASLATPETVDRISERDEDLKVGIDEKNSKLAAVSEEKLMDRISRLKTYKKEIQAKEDLWSANLERCRLMVKEIQ